MTHHLNGGIPNWGYTHWYKFFNARQLLTHTQGNHLNLSREFQVAFNPNRVQEFNRLAFDYKPGTHFAYSQTGPAVLNAVVQRAVGRDFQAFAQDELFTPLGIERNNYFWMRDASGWTEGYAQLHCARSMPPSEIGEILLQTSSKSVPNSCIRSNLRSARTKFCERCGSGMPSKSRKGWYAQIESPSSPQSAATSLGRPSKASRSFSKISTASNSAFAMARNFSSSVPLSETVAMERLTMDHPC